MDYGVYRVLIQYSYSNHTESIHQGFSKYATNCYRMLQNARFATWCRREIIEGHDICYGFFASVG